MYSIIYRNNKPWVHCVGQSTVHHYTAGHTCTTEVPAVWICQWIHVKPNCIESLFKRFPCAPSHILKCSPDLNRYGLRPPGPLVYQKVFLKQKSMGGTFHTHRQKCEKETLRKFMILCVCWTDSLSVEKCNFQQEIWVFGIFFYL